MNNINNVEVLVLPLWKTCLEDMIQDGIDYGKIYETKWFEDKLRCLRSTMEFGLAISEIRRELEKEGFYLSGRGQNGNQFIVIPADSNQDILRHYCSLANDCFKRGIILGKRTKREALSPDKVAQHEAILERMENKFALLKRSEQIKKVVDKHSPKLISLEGR